MEERRKSRRIGFNLKVSAVPEEGGASIEFLRANIGWGGLGGYTRSAVQAGSGVLIRISFSQRSGETLSEEIFGKTVWARRDGNFNALGIAFFSEPAASQPQLSAYLQYSDQFD